MIASESLYLNLDRVSAFGLYDAPAQSVPQGAAVVICPPWGWDEIASYRSRRAWARQLAAAGHPTLRFDLPGAGDSSGTPFDAELVEAWIASVTTAADWLRHRSGAAEVVLLGLGLGGLLARAAIARGAAVDGLVLWGAPASGRAFVREARAFSRMQPWSGERLEEVHPGSLEAGGFVLSAATRAELERLETEPPAGTPLRRALLLDRDGIGGDESAGESLEAAAVEVERAHGAGWGEMVVHPESTRLSASSVATVERWLGVPPPPAPQLSAPVSFETTGSLAGDGFRERAWTLDQPFGTAFGVLTEPADGAAGDLCAIFLNSGATPHIGPNRLWVEAARAAASAGIPSLRLDLEAIGESDGDSSKFLDVATFYAPHYEAQVHAVIANLADQGVAERFFLTGLCSGSYWSFRTALEDRRVDNVLLINSGAMIWDPNLVSERALREMDRFRQGDWWRRLFKGQISAAGGLRALKVLGRRAIEVGSRLLRRLSRQREFERTVESEFDLLSDRDLRLTLAFSAGEALHFELERDGVLAKLDRWPNVKLAELPGEDHSLRPVEAQRAAVELIASELAASARADFAPLAPKVS